MPEDTTPDELERRADEIERVAKERIEEHWRVAHGEAEQLRKAAAILRGLGQQIAEQDRVAESWGLPSPADNATLAAMDTSTILDRSPRGRKFKADHPMVERAKALKKPMHAVAAELEKKLKRRFPRTTVRSWYVEAGSDHARPIPKDVAEYFARKPWGIPLQAWKHGISDT